MYISVVFLQRIVVKTEEEYPLECNPWSVVLSMWSLVLFERCIFPNITSAEVASTHRIQIHTVQDLVKEFLRLKPQTSGPPRKESGGAFTELSNENKMKNEVLKLIRCMSGHTPGHASWGRPRATQITPAASISRDPEVDLKLAKERSFFAVAALV
ncbi:hypothetical protein KQX54_019900 [Cotesia glomerata]|uniref:Uncharacterized protein n=1 Tax=Cotesia glomerata TaxID=32391 RepID=A0AAV7HZI2_COTGL|nr:hypothetical protein KQX54_019900 [Cotesia glomerata]